METGFNPWVWVACLGGAGGVLSAWMTRFGAIPPHHRPSRTARQATAIRLAIVVVAAGTSSAIAWLVGGAGEGEHSSTGQTASALAFFWIGFVTAGWITAERDKHVLRQAVCRAATAPAAHPDTIRGFAHASPEAVYEAVSALMPRRVPR